MIGTVRRYAISEDAVGYLHRDPARLSPARIAELEAHDRRIEMLQAASRTETAGAPRDLGTARARYGQLRRQGATITAAAALAGVTRNTGTRWERSR